MKKLLVLIVASFVVLFFACQPGSRLFETTMSDAPTISDQGPALAGVKNTCATIRDGTIIASRTNDVIVLGYDQWGYNYQAHLFNGMLSDYSRGQPDYPEWSDIKLVMKWNDTWLSNMDCDADNRLDRHFGYPTYRGSGAWLTNHQSGIVDGKRRTYFVKIVSVPLDATLVNEIWYNADGGEIGPVIWTHHAIIQEQGYGFETDTEIPRYRSPVGSGLGRY